MVPASVSLKDISKEAGVSYSTTSHILNLKGHRYSAATRERVEKAAQRLNYIPNQVARSMVMGETRCIGFVGLTFSRWMAVRKLDSIINRAKLDGYDCLVTGSENGEAADEEGQINQLLARRVDGLLVLAKRDTNFELLEKVQKRGIPIVAVDYVPEECSIPTVGIDHERGGYILGRHLMELGHTTIAAAYGKYHGTLKGGRLSGIRKALAERGLTLPDERVMMCESLDPETAYHFTKEQMQQKDRSTAIVYSNDERAMVGLHALKDMNVDCPSEVSVVGHDNFPFAAYAMPPLTTLEQPREELGRMAVQLLLDQIKNGISSSRIVMKLEPTLIVRKSTAAACRR